MFRGHEMRVARQRVDDNCSGWQRVHFSCGENSVLSTHQPTTTSMAFQPKTLIDICSQNGPGGLPGVGEGIAVGEVVISPAQPTWPMTRSQCHGVIQEEERSPCSRSIQGMIPITKLGSAGDPQLSVVMTHKPAGFINQTTAISREEPTARYGVEVSPWINPVSKWHLSIMAAVTDQEARR